MQCLPRNFFHDEALDDVAFLDIGIILKADTALIAVRNFLNRVLETLERGELAFVNDDVVAQQANLRIALELARR